MTDTLTINEIVRPMERGQITLPIAIRKKLKITPKTWLWVRLIKNNSILIKPVEERSAPVGLLAYLKHVANDKKTYWKKQDSAALNKIKSRSLQRLRKMVE